MQTIRHLKYRVEGQSQTLGIDGDGLIIGDGGICKAGHVFCLEFRCVCPYDTIICVYTFN